MQHSITVVRHNNETTSHKAGYTAYLRNGKGNQTSRRGVKFDSLTALLVFLRTNHSGLRCMVQENRKTTFIDAGGCAFWEDGLNGQPMVFINCFNGNTSIIAKPGKRFKIHTIADCGEFTTKPADNGNTVDSFTFAVEAPRATKATKAKATPATQPTTTTEIERHLEAMAMGGIDAVQSAPVDLTQYVPMVDYVALQDQLAIQAQQLADLKASTVSADDYAALEVRLNNATTAYNGLVVEFKEAMQMVAGYESRLAEAGLSIDVDDLNNITDSGVTGDHQRGNLAPITLATPTTTEVHNDGCSDSYAHDATCIGNGNVVDCHSDGGSCDSANGEPVEENNDGDVLATLFDETLDMESGRREYAGSALPPAVDDATDNTKGDAVLTVEEAVVVNEDVSNDDTLLLVEMDRVATPAYSIPANDADVFDDETRAMLNPTNCRTIGVYGMFAGSRVDTRTLDVSNWSF